MTAAAKIVDYEHLHSQAAGDKSVMREVLKLFIEHTQQVIDELERAGDEKTWKLWTHTLKGSARGVGAFAVADAAADAERHSLDKTKIEPLKVAFAAARTYIDGHPV
jgi:HPt (histidine-containing phosphotransfer) domain-containing protein